MGKARGSAVSMLKKVRSIIPFKNPRGFESIRTFESFGHQSSLLCKHDINTNTTSDITKIV